MLSKRILVLMFLLLFLPLVGCLPGLTPSTPDGISTGTITGVINGSPGVPLSGANVSIGGTGLSTITDSSGAYRLSDVPPGSYHLIVTYQGKQIKKKIIFTAGVTITLNISFSQEQQAEEEIKNAISGRIMIPSLKTAKDITGWVPLANATVTLTDSEGVTHTVATDKNGYYTFTDVAVNANTIITATGTVNGNTVIVKDVIPQAVAVYGYYYAGTADAESTALALIVEELLEQGLDPKDIDLEGIQDSDNFTAVVVQVSSTLDENGDVTTDPGVTGAVGNVAEEINPPPPPPPTPPITLDYILVLPEIMILFEGGEVGNIASINAYYDNGTVVNINPSNCTIVSDNPAVATVDIYGIVTSVNPGTAIITVNYAGKTDTIKVTVSKCVSSFSKTYQTTTTSTQFYLAIGLAPPSYFTPPFPPGASPVEVANSSIAFAPTYNIFNHMTDGTFLFEDIQFGSSSEGQTYTISSVNDDSDFDDFTTFLMNGIDDQIWEAWIWPIDGTGAGGQRCTGDQLGLFYESEVFLGTDYPGWTIQSVSLTFDDIYTVHSGDFDWLTMDYTVNIYAVPPTL